ncbi:LysM peptidoglycan-binding domain-containing protein [bacterium]|nr:LysM peptidoglycan-binding domain-containing protein [bacterium]
MNVTLMMNKKYKAYPCRLVPFMMVLVAVLFPVILHAQVPVPVEVSKQKIVTEGKVYYIHTVLKGQTLYSISKAYNVSIDQISLDNKLEANGIREGQVLRIRASNGSQPSPQGQPETRSANNGATIPAQTGAAAPAKPLPQDERYLYHKVIKGETLATIAGLYGISVRDLKRANKGLLFPHEGDNLMIPRKKMNDQSRERETATAATSVKPDTLMADSINLADEAEVFTVAGERTVISRLNGSLKVAVLLPFFTDENNTRSYIDSTRRDAEGNKIYREVIRPEGWIYEGSMPFLEAYEGILVAVDSLRTLGLVVELDVYDTGADPYRTTSLINSGVLDKTDLIIGPVFSNIVEIVSSWAAERNIPVVSPVGLRDRSILENKPTLYRVFPSENVAQDMMAGELRRHRGSNILFLYADSAMTDPETGILWEKVRKVMAEVGEDSTTNLTPYYFTGLTARSDAYSGVTSIDNLLDASRENVIILASTNTPVVSSTFSTLHSLSRKYDIKVVGYPEIRGLETVDLRYYYDLGLSVPAESYIDFNAPASQAFITAFRRKFRTEPMAESFAWRGFDIAWYFIGGLATGGKDFLRDPGIFNPELLSLEPDFRRESRVSGYENRGMFILNYRKDMTIDVRRPWPRQVTK